MRLAFHVLPKFDDFTRFDPIFIEALFAYQITVERQSSDVVHATDVTRNEHPVAKNATVSAHFLASLTRLLP